MRSVRERLEDREDAWLCPAGTRSRGAARPRRETPCDLRTEFQRDRDRIIHSKAFRRLKYKTQVFLPPAGDHMRTRMTHTLEVTQIARTIARALDLNEDLAEAIGLGHDLGHTPFGHAGERALARVYPGFRHNEQSLRVVDRLEHNGAGLNLTEATRDGILRHSKPEKAIEGVVSGVAATPEGRVVKLADGIAYINHDLDDALRGGLIEGTELPEIVTIQLGATHGERINALVTGAVETSRPRIAAGDSGAQDIALGDDMLQAANALRDFLFERVYAPINQLPATRHAESIVEELFEYFCKYPEELPSDVPCFDGEGVERHVADVVSGMTDRFAVHCYSRWFRPLAEEL